MERALATAQSITGSLTIGFHPGLAHGPLNAGIAEFRETRPDVELRLVEASPTELHRQLNERMIDIMFAGLIPRPWGRCQCPGTAVGRKSRCRDAGRSSPCGKRKPALVGYLFVADYHACAPGRPLGVSHDRSANGRSAVRMQSTRRFARRSDRNGQAWLGRNHHIRECDGRNPAWDRTALYKGRLSQ